MKALISKRIVISIVLLLTLIVLVGCIPRVKPGNKAPVITSSPVTVATVGVAYTYQVKATDADGDTLTYSLTKKPTGMTIVPDTGLITWTPDSSQIGTHDVTVKVSDGKEEVFQSFKITVSKASPTPPSTPSNRAPKITSSPITTVTVDGLYTYEVKATDADGDTLTYSLTKKPTGMEIDPDTGLITWTPDSTQIGKHDVTIEVSDGKAKTTQSFEVIVFDILESITVAPKTMTLFVTETGNITSVKASYKYGPDKTIPLLSCSYSTSAAGVATVTTSGVITGVAAGTATITVSYKEGTITKTDTVEVTVNPIELQSITVVPKTMTLYTTQTGNITSVIASYNYGPNYSIILSNCTFSSNNTSVATVSTSGVITGVAAGYATITVSYTEGSITKTDTVEVTVNPINLISITVAPKTMTLYTTQSGNIASVTASYNYGPTKSIALSDCNYSSDDDSIATVSTSGVITGVDAGLATITVSYNEGSITKTDTVEVTVVKVANLELTPATQTISSGSPVTINVIVEDVTDLFGANIVLNFDAQKLQYASSAVGSFLPEPRFCIVDPADIDNTNGSVKISATALGYGNTASGTGTIMTVTFNTIATGTANITFGTTLLKDTDNDPITPHTKGSGCSVTITS